jgi:hypothetical protein
MRTRAEAAAMRPDARVKWLVDWINQNLMVGEGWNDRRLIIFTKQQPLTAGHRHAGHAPRNKALRVATCGLGLEVWRRSLSQTQALPNLRHIDGSPLSVKINNRIAYRGPDVERRCWISSDQDDASS